MRRNDFVFFGLTVGVLLLVAAPALLRPDLILGNFGDIAGYHYPLQHLTAAALHSGQLPFWNSYIFAGLPHLANTQTALWYPLAILLRTFPLVWAFTLYAVLHLIWAALGMHLFLRRRGLSAAGAAVLAATFALCPFLVYRIAQGIPTHLAALSWAPWCWLALESRRRGLLAVAWTLQAFSGHPQFAVINAVAMLGYAACQPERLLAMRCAVRSGLWAGVLTAIVWVPMLEFLRHSNRGGLPAVFSQAYAMPWKALLTVLSPGLVGEPLAGTFAGVPSVFFESYGLYLGLLPLGLALWAWSRRQEAASGLLVIAGLVLALGIDAPFSRVPARFSFWLLWGVLLAAAAGWKLWKPSPRWAAAALLFVLLDLGSWAAYWVYTDDPQPRLGSNKEFSHALGGRTQRFASGLDLANPNKAMLYRALNVNGYDAFYLGSYIRYAARAQGRAAGDPSRTYITRVQSPEMRRLGVNYYLSAEPLLSPGEGVRLQRNHGAFPLAYYTAGGVVPRAATVGPDLQAVKPEHWIARGFVPAEKDAQVVFSVPNYPGWRAYVNGLRVPLHVFDELVSAVPLQSVAPGKFFRADLVFQPTLWPFLVMLSVGGWLVWSRRRLVEVAT
jgi:hypothetical protein